jgi:DNA processing protein
LGQPPAQLYAIGDASLLERKLVAIVGTRNATGYGLRWARSIAAALAESGVGIVSGMARGIDAAAHRAALDAGGDTVAVLGTGIDVPYPAAHRELHETLGRRGLVLSESGPGAPAYRGSFPKRNRIIAALGIATIVIEAGHHSGALNTASHAMDLSRPVAALPGPIDSPESAGANQLLRDGAIVIASIDDALALAGVTRAAQKTPIHLDASEAKVWAASGTESMSIDVIASRAGLTTRDCLTAVTSLEMAGLVECLITGEIRRR